MALIRCSKCGKEISTKSSNCIHCGNPVKMTKDDKIIILDDESERNIRGLGIISIIACLMFFILGAVIIGYGIDADDDFTALMVITGISVMVGGIILSTFINWMALLLKNIYEINRKV